MKVLIDENIPGAASVFGRLGEVRMLPGRAITRTVLHDIDALLIRSVTRVDRALLAGTPVRFVASATAGIDHVDTPALAELGIAFAHAPGSNADSVVDYVLAVLALAFPGPAGLRGRSVGIVGCGQVGGRLLRRLRALGIRCLVHDPLLGDAAPPEEASFADVLAADVVSLHVPLTREGVHATHHLIGTRELHALREGALLINAARGAVVDNEALRDVLLARPRLRAALDVWEGEPLPDRSLQAHVLIGTPHIAGYAWDGKLRGARQVFEALAAFVGVVIDADVAAGLEASPAGDLHAGCCGCWQDGVLACYDPRRDDARLRAATLDEEHAVRAAAFDRLRRDYPQRREFSAWRIGAAVSSDSVRYRELLAAGFSA